MYKRKWIALLTCLSLTTLSVGVPAGTKAQKTSHNIQTFHQVITGENNGLMRYRLLDEQGKEILPATQDQSSQNTSLKKASSLPSSYDARETGVITPVKDQGYSGACWAFAALKSLEASSILNNLSSLDTTDYSENHMAWYTYTPLLDNTNPLYGDYFSYTERNDSNIYDIGGNFWNATFTLANWWGAALESDVPFQASTQEEQNEMTETMKKAGDSLRTLSSVHLKETNCYFNYDSKGTPMTSSTRDQIKQAVIDHGALDVSLYYSSDNLYNKNNVTSLYQNRRDSSYANHCVTIVGWDDSFNTFQTRAPKSGAWLIANSYGEDFGMDGYFWVSYYDTSLCEFVSFEAEDTDTYTTNFQYDGNGWSTGFLDTDDIAIANVFTNQTDTPQRIDAAAFYTCANNQGYKIQIYRNISSDSPLAGEPVSACTTIGTADWPGYHTVPLEQSIAVAPGESFSVVVTFLADTSEDGIAYACFEGESDPQNYCNYSSEAGQSYVYFASLDEWYDTTSYVDEGTVYNGNNVCVKALANEISPEEFAAQEKNYVPETMPPQTDTDSPSFSPAPAPDATVPVTAPVTTTPTATPALPASTAATDTPEAKTSTKIKLTATKFTIGKGEKITLPLKVTPSSSKKKLTFTSSNRKAVKISSAGKITGRKKGKATITISSSDGSKKKVSVVVKKAPSSVRLKTSKTTLKKGKTTRLKTILSKGSASYGLTYRSSKPKVASVNAKGKIRARKKGTTRITVRTYNGKKARIKIRVTE